MVRSSRISPTIDETVAVTDDHDVRFDHAQFRTDDQVLNFENTKFETRHNNRSHSIGQNSLPEASDSDHKYYSIDRAKELLGYEPRDNSADHAD